MASFYFLREVTVTVSVILGGLVLSGNVGNAEESFDPRPFIWEPTTTDGRALLGHVSQRDVEDGVWTSQQLIEAGRLLFLANFTRKDGAGRPGSTGDGTPTRRPLGSGKSFVRTAGPDANACASCHRRPSIGGAGDFVANVFTGLGARHPIFHSIDSAFSSERDTPDLYGSGAIELLAREMTRDLHQIRSTAVEVALATDADTRRELVTKGVSYGFLTARADGSLSLGEVRGIDRDLVVRPWGQKGTTTSLRTFSVTASNLHHGMQAEERFGLHLTGSEDFDRDGIGLELSEGDITAMTIFQAAMPIPGRAMPNEESAHREVVLGEELFENSPCAACHVPALPLDGAVFDEPGPFNLEGTLRDTEVQKVFSIDLTKDIPSPRLESREDGKIYVRLYSDLKRHKISDDERPHFGNESLVEGLTTTDEFMTRRLWTTGNTGPYGHRGDLTTIYEAIDMHGGEARSARKWFESEPAEVKDAIVAFLRSMQALPAGSASVIFEQKNPDLPYAQ